MCGLAGIYLPEGAAEVKADLSAMLASMKHRGPNGHGEWTSPDRRYRCGFVRLAIIDPEHSDQPLVERGSGRVLVGNGEVYNYRELRNQEADYPYQTNGDMEAVLALSHRIGDAFVDHLNGMYALALYQPDRLLLVRDRLGIKPLYWSRLPGGGVLFASETKALFASGLLTPQVDESVIGSYLAHGYISAPATLWRGVNKLQAGHCLSINKRGDLQIRRYWQPQAKAGRQTSVEECAEQITELLEDSIRLQLRSDVPLGCLLSGGLDSGLIVALAARHLDQPLHTYTVRFDGGKIDESPLAAMVAERYGTKHTVYDLPSVSVSDHLPRLLWHCDEPLADASLLPNQLIQDVLGKQVRVALNGTGGDELFAGYGRYFQLPVERNYLRFPAYVRRRIIEPLLERVDPMLAWRLRRAEMFEQDRGQYLHDHSTLFPQAMRRLIGFPGQGVTAAQKSAFAEFHGSVDAAMLASEISTYLVEDLLLLLDRTSMAASVEGRVPFLDHRLVEAALALPHSFRCHNGKQKGLERLIARQYLPEGVVEAPKQGFASPVSVWMKGPLGALSKRLLTSKRSLERGWWHREGILRMLADPSRHGHRIYALVVLELSIRLHAEHRLGECPDQGLEAFLDD